MAKFTNEFKKNIVLRYAEGESVEKLSTEIGVGKTTIYDWINAFSNCVQLSGIQKTIKIQADRIIRLEKMIEIIQSCDFFIDVPLEKKLEIIDNLYSVYGINVTCDALGVAHGTFHNHQKRGKGYGRQWLHEKRKRELLDEIINIDNDYHHIYGADKITAELKRRGYKTCKKTVLKIMNEEGISSIRSYANDYKKSNNKSRKQNIVNRQFNPKSANKIWVSDVTYLRIDDKNRNTFYLCVIMDLFSRRIIAYNIGLSNSKQLVNATLRKAVDCRDFRDDLIFHSDRGSNYVSTSFNNNLKKHGITQSFSRPGCPYDNSPMESFFQLFKKECFYRHIFTSKSMLMRTVDEYIDFYNNERSHRYLNYLSPVEFENKHYQN